MMEDALVVSPDPSKITKSPPSNVRIPPEITGLIAAHLDTPDLLTFRAVDKTYYTGAAHLFADEFFTEINVFMSRRSLTALSAICADPYLGPYVKRIHFSSCRLSESVSSKRDLEDIDFFVSALQLATTRLEDVTVPYRHIIDEQRKLEESGEALQVLSTAFGHLKRHGGKVTLGMIDTFVDREPPVPILGRKHFHNLVHKGRYSYRVHNSQTARLLLDAAADSGIVADGFSIRTGERSYKVPGLAGLPHSNSLSAVGQSLRCLDLTFDCCDANMRRLCKRLATHSPALTTLRLGSEIGLRSSGYFDSHNEILSSVATTTLHELNITNIAIAGNDCSKTCLGVLLMRQKKTLRRLRIRDCYMDRYSGWSAWSSFITLIQQEFQLETFQIENQARTHELMKSRTFEGKEAVNAGLLELIAELEQMDDSPESSADDSDE